jgi:hypothetical protein
MFFSRDCEQLFNRNGERYATSQVTQKAGRSFPLLLTLIACQKTKKAYYGESASPMWSETSWVFRFKHVLACSSALLASARDGIEPQTPAFSGLRTIQLGGTKSADVSESKSFMFA